MQHSLIDTALVAMPDRHDGDINANPKIRKLVDRHDKEINNYPPDKA